jgi:hypothetical protein
LTVSRHIVKCYLLLIAKKRNDLGFCGFHLVDNIRLSFIFDRWLAFSVPYGIVAYYSV